MLGYIIVFGPFVIAFAIVLLLVKINRDKRKKVMTQEKLELVKKAKTKLILILDLMQFWVSTVITISLVIIPIVYVFLSIESEKLAKEFRYLASWNEDPRYNFANAVTGSLEIISIGAIIYALLYLILMYRIRKSKKMSEEEKNAMQEYYRGRTIYLILLCIVLIIFTYIISLVVSPAMYTI